MFDRHRQSSLPLQIIVTSVDAAAVCNNSMISLARILGKEYHAYFSQLKFCLFILTFNKGH